MSTDLDEERAAIEERGRELAAKVPPLGPRTTAELARLMGSPDGDRVEAARRSRGGGEPDISPTETPRAATWANGSVTSGDDAMNPERGA